jgi:hypothetical protein
LCSEAFYERSASAALAELGRFGCGVSAELPGVSAKGAANDFGNRRSIERSGFLQEVLV